MRNFAIGCIVLFTMAGTAFSETKEPPKKLSVDLGGGVKMEMVLVPAGEFKMGSGESAEATAAFFNKTYGEDLVKQSVSRTSIRSTACESRSRSTWARTMSRGASFASSSMTPATRRTRRREIEPGRIRLGP